MKFPVALFIVTKYWLKVINYLARALSLKCLKLRSALKTKM